ncbi:hypothetical protein BpHYR1_031198 [Brachionus plicatilis]|uniref:RNA-directed DNA polymerase from mobile element jockey-like n=1 Tax=Brachionus plicatilis TaxID=10195 RepID=A0A3M7T7Q6_BRAPC|nr:hypothetical protein BpHYR1_031198 [Brachionus plicatilis]
MHHLYIKPFRLRTGFPPLDNLYNPPNIELPFELFLEISRKCGKFIIGGDLNAKTKSLGCLRENENALILEKIINWLNLSTEYYEVLDIFLIPYSLSDRVHDFKVLIDDYMLTNWGLYQDQLKSSSQHNKRGKMRKLFQKSRCPSIKVSFNKLTSELRLGLKKFWNQNWLDFMNKIGKNPLSNTDKEKIIGDLLATTFSPHLDFVGSDDNCEVYKQ